MAGMSIYNLRIQSASLSKKLPLFYLYVFSAHSAENTYKNNRNTLLPQAKGTALE
jgi:hypothetical protein